MFKLSKLTDYAVVILGDMAKTPGQKLTSAILASRTNLPEPTVAKILKTLARCDLLQSSRGVNGGYTLTANIADIRITDVITAIDGPVAVTACADGEDGACCHEDMCRMKGKWSPVNAAVKNALNTITLADMVR